MIEIPPKFAGCAPVGPFPDSERDGLLGVTTDWRDSAGLAEDVRRYGAWMRSEAQKRIGSLYPPIVVTSSISEDRPDLKPLIGQTLTVVAWIWARTVKSPNPAFSHVDVPLASTFVLSRKEGKAAYVQPVIEGDDDSSSSLSTPPAAEEGTKSEGRGADFRCIVSDAPMSGDYIKGEGQAGRMGARLMAVVAEGKRGRVYLNPTSEMEEIARSAKPAWKPSGEVPARLSGGTCVPYGLTQWGDLFTPRQLVAMTTLTDLIAEAREKATCEARAAGRSDDSQNLEAGGTGATAYAEAISVYLAFCVDKMADTNTTLCSWQVDPPRLRATFGRALPMVWDYAGMARRYGWRVPSAFNR